MFKRVLLFFALCWVPAIASPPYVEMYFAGRTGNKMFQIATAYALAWENGAEAVFPHLDPSSEEYKHFFFRCNLSKASVPYTYFWGERSSTYAKIDYRPNMRLSGFFQSHKYFSDYRDQVVELFQPHPDDLQYIKEHYGWLMENKETVGIHIRSFYTEDRKQVQTFYQYGKKYLTQAMQLFPPSALYIICSDDIAFAKREVPARMKNVIFIQHEPPHIDFHILALCKHNLITNSSFGWWAAYINKNPSKIVVRPYKWMKGNACESPEDWILLDAKPEC